MIYKKMKKVGLTIYKLSKLVMKSKKEFDATRKYWEHRLIKGYPLIRKIKKPYSGILNQMATKT